MKIWTTLTIGTIAFALVGGDGYIGFRSSQPPVQETPEPPPTVPVTTCDVEQSVTAPGNLVNAREVALEMPAAGRLAEVLVRPGETVQSGQVLARLDDREKFEAAVTAANLELLQARQALEEVQESSSKESAEAQLALAEAQQALDDAERKRTRLDYSRASDDLVIEDARATYALAKEDYKQALKIYNKFDHRPDKDRDRAMAVDALLAAKQRMERALAILNWYLLPPGEDEIAQADAELALARATLEEAQKDWELLKDGPDPLAIQVAEAEVANAEAWLQAAEKELAGVEIRAPFAGVVLEVEVKPGETVPAGTAVIVLNDPQSLEIEATVIEEDLPYVQAGQPVNVFFDALPDAEVTGTVSRIVPRRAPGDRPLYYVYITLDQVPEKVVAGMTADSSVVIARQPGVLCLPRSIVRAAPGGISRVEVWANGQREERSVEVGLRGDVYVEIQSGLAEGEQVVAK